MRFAYAVAGSRALLALVFSIAFIVTPEALMPGSSAEPARSLALLFVSRNIAFGIALLVLVVRRINGPLAWVLIVDIALQIYDAAYAHDATAIVPVVIGVLEALAARQLLKR
jgi:hypothetical protein